MILDLILIAVIVVELFVLVKSTTRRKKHNYVGEIQVTETDEKKSYNLVYYDDPYDLDQMEHALFKVVSLRTDGPRE